MQKIFLHLLVVLLLPIYAAEEEAKALSEHQKGVVAYFKEVVLGFEFGKAEPVTRKWKTNMKVFVMGTTNSTLTNELEKIVGELNQLITDNIEIEIVSSKEDSNFTVFFGNSHDFGVLHPGDAALAKNNSGLFRIFWNTKNEISKGYLYVDTNTSIQEQRHTIREELTQSLGLGTDSSLYNESIFQSNWTIPTAYAPIDKDIIRLLYHPKVKVGLTASEVDVVLTEILLSESGA